MRSTSCPGPPACRHPIAPEFPAVKDVPAYEFTVRRNGDRCSFRVNGHVTVCMRTFLPFADQRTPFYIPDLDDIRVFLEGAWPPLVHACGDREEFSLAQKRQCPSGHVFWESKYGFAVEYPVYGARHSSSQSTFCAVLPGARVPKQTDGTGDRQPNHHLLAYVPHAGSLLERSQMILNGLDGLANGLSYCSAKPAVRKYLAAAP
jgi:hypothetical protein